MEDFDGMTAMSGEEFVAWMRSMVANNPDSVFVVQMETPVDDGAIPYEAHDMDKTVHFRHCCPHNNMHGTQDIELELDGHHVLMRGYHNGQRVPGFDGEWPVVRRFIDNDDALRSYLRIRQSFVSHDFEIVDA